MKKGKEKMTGDESLPLLRSAADNDDDANLWDAVCLCVHLVSVCVSLSFVCYGCCPSDPMHWGEFTVSSLIPVPPFFPAMPFDCC